MRTLTSHDTERRQARLLTPYVAQQAQAIISLPAPQRKRE